MEDRKNEENGQISMGLGVENLNHDMDFCESPEQHNLLEKERI